MKKTTFLIFLAMSIIQTTSFIDAISDEEFDKALQEAQTNCDSYDPESREQYTETLNKLFSEYFFSNPEDFQGNDE